MLNKRIFAYKCELIIHDVQAPAHARTHIEPVDASLARIAWNVEKWTEADWDIARSLWLNYQHTSLKIEAFAGTEALAKKHFQILSEMFSPIKAAGGIVENENHEILLIYRKGHWDLPKGKVDKGETTEAAAVREISEETGIHPPEIRKYLGKTWHVYPFKEAWVLKDTHWYQMKSKDTRKLIPQTEEDITEVRWVRIQDLKDYYPDMYPLIRELILAYLKKE